MSQLIKNVATKDLDELLALNQSEVPHVGSIDIERMHWFAENADYFRVAWLDNRIAGFLIGLQPGSTYQSPNYRWFCEHYDRFGYVDRIAVTTAARGHGIARTLYDDFAAALPEQDLVYSSTQFFAFASSKDEQQPLVFAAGAVAFSAVSLAVLSAFTALVSFFTVSVVFALSSGFFSSVV